MNKNVFTRYLLPTAMLVTSILGCAGELGDYHIQQGNVSLSADYDYEPPDSPDAFLDLDTGIIGDTDRGDIQFIVSGGSALFEVLYPVNGARAGALGVDEPGIEGCGEAAASLADQAVSQVFPGSYLCVLTDQGRLAQLRVEAVDHRGDGSIQLSFITWDKAAIAETTPCK